MSIVYTWNVNTLETAASENDLSDVIRTVHWRLSATDGVHNDEIIGTVYLGEPNADNFTEFNSITEQQVIAWVESKVELENLKKILEDRLSVLANPPIVIKQGPWAHNT